MSIVSRLQWALLVCLFAGGCQSESAETVVPLALGAPDAADPAQAALIQWHRALVDGDFAAYAEVDFHAVGATEAERRWFFDTIRPSVPEQILVSDGTGNFDELVPAADRALVEKLRVFTLVGCSAQSGNSNESRSVAVVDIREQDGKWKVGGSSFGPPNEYTEGPCPMASAGGLGS